MILKFLICRNASYQWWKLSSSSSKRLLFCATCLLHHSSHQAKIFSLRCVPDNSFMPFQPFPLFSFKFRSIFRDTYPLVAMADRCGLVCTCTQSSILGPVRFPRWIARSNQAFNRFSMAIACAVLARGNQDQFVYLRHHPFGWPFYHRFAGGSLIGGRCTCFLARNVVSGGLVGVKTSRLLCWCSRKAKSLTAGPDPGLQFWSQLTATCSIAKWTPWWLVALGVIFNKFMAGSFLQGSPFDWVLVANVKTFWISAALWRHVKLDK